MMNEHFCQQTTVTLNLFQGLNWYLESKMLKRVQHREEVCRYLPIASRWGGLPQAASRAIVITCG